MSSYCLIGAGNLGSRHLQSLVELAAQQPSAPDILVFEPSSEATSVALQRAGSTATSLNRPDIAKAIKTAAALDSVPDSVDLAIVATSSRPRRMLVEKLLERATPKALVLEKFLFPSPDDYAAVGALLSAKSIPTWVNCPRASWAGYQWLHDELQGRGGPIHLSVSGSRFGLLCNGIHFLELFRYLVGSPGVQLKFDASGMVYPVEESKRAGYVEMAGTLRATAPDGSTVTLHSLPGGNTPLTLSLISDRARYQIDEAKGVIAYDDDAGKKAEQALALRHVSQMAADWQQLMQGQSPLPLYAHSAELHLAFIAALAGLIPAGLCQDVPFPVT